MENLSLELGCGTGSSCSVKSCGFTVLQMQELQLQALIFKYMEAGLPVPHHLLLPIWKSFAVASSHSGFHHFFPSFFGHGGMQFEYRNGMDPEPGRCRRTDGKKWRCSKDAVQNHKYCERHMHRGKHRSRKLVEPTSTTTTTARTDSYRGISSTIRMGIDQTTTNTNLSISLPVANFIPNV